MVGLEQFDGIVGHTSDVEFGELVDVLASYEVIDEELTELDTRQRIATVYKDRESRGLYELWFDVKTPDTPDGMDFLYGFNKVTYY